MATPSLTKYERVQVLAARVQQLNAGAPTALPWTEGQSTYSIALSELEQGQMPIAVRRLHPNQTHSPDPPAARAPGGGDHA